MKKKKDFSDYIIFQDGTFWVDLEDCESGEELCEKGDIIKWKFEGKKFEGEVKESYEEVLGDVSEVWKVKEIV